MGVNRHVRGLAQLKLKKQTNKLEFELEYIEKNGNIHGKELTWEEKLFCFAVWVMVGGA